MLSSHSNNYPTTLLLSGGPHNTPQQRANATPDYLLPFDQLMRRAQSGDPSAQLLVGFSLRTGDYGCVINKEEGAKWLETAAKNINVGPATLCAQALCYQGAIGGITIKNNDLAKSYYLDAANQGYIPAKYLLATMLFDESFTTTTSTGTGAAYHQSATHTHVDTGLLSKAINFMTICAEAGFVPSIAYLGYCYRNGYGVKQDHAEALKLFRMAADKGSAYAKEHVGDYYYRGMGGVDKDKKEARNWYLEAVSQGRVISKNRLKKSGACSII